MHSQTLCRILPHPRLSGVNNGGCTHLECLLRRISWYEVAFLVLLGTQHLLVAFFARIYIPVVQDSQQRFCICRYSHAERDSGLISDSKDGDCCWRCPAGLSFHSRWAPFLCPDQEIEYSTNRRLLDSVGFGKCNPNSSNYAKWWLIDSYCRLGDRDDRWY